MSSAGQFMKQQKEHAQGVPCERRIARNSPAQAERESRLPKKHPWTGHLVDPLQQATKTRQNAQEKRGAGLLQVCNGMTPPHSTPHRPESLSCGEDCNWKCRLKTQGLEQSQADNAQSAAPRRTPVTNRGFLLQ